MFEKLNHTNAKKFNFCKFFTNQKEFMCRKEVIPSLPPLIIVECPSCKDEYIKKHYRSHAYNAIWTDGLLTDSIIIDFHDNFFACCECGNYLWIPKCNNVCVKSESVDYNKKYRVMKLLKDPSEEDYLNAVNLGIFENRVEEMYLRIRAWQASNNPFRAEIIFYNFSLRGTQLFIENSSSDKDTFDDIKSVLEEHTQDLDVENLEEKRIIHSRTQSAINNMEIIIQKLMDDDQYERMLKAEALRELGYFDDSISLLQTSFNNRDQQYYAELIRELSKEKKSEVAKVTSLTHVTTVGDYVDYYDKFNTELSILFGMQI